MDFKYKHFRQQRIFAVSPEELFNVARAVITKSAGWTVTKETAEGFTAQGSGFGHAGIADVHIASSGGGTIVEIQLRVERAGFSGFMLFDVGGYYNIQIRKWLDAMQASLHQPATGQAPSTPAALQPPNKSAARLFHGCLLLIGVAIGFYLLVTVVEAAVGLATGNLFLIGRNGNLVVHGAAARAISAVILLFGAWVVWKMIKKPHGRSVIP
jgi:hypothetical protein